MRYLAAIGLVLASVGAWGQIPDVRARVDLTVSYISRDGSASALRFYDPLGRPSTVSFTVFLEPGLRAYAAQRLQRIPSDPDRDPLDELYVEDEGIWRIGKQYLPFGSGQILRESVVAARGDTNLIFERFPVSLALCDGGPGRQRGVVGRIGRRTVGFSFAIGENFGIAPTALGVVRTPEDSPGVGNGWRQAFGIDISRRSGIFQSHAEYVSLRNGSGPNLDILDVTATSNPTRYQSLTIGYTRTIPTRAELYRFQGSIFVYQGITFEPLLRYRNSKVMDVSLALRCRF